MRQREARALLRAKQFAGAYYLAGYAVECALKACIAKQTRRYDFPDKSLAQDAHVHDLERLLRLGGLEPDFSKALASDPKLQLNWAVVKDWKVSARYDTTMGEAPAKDLISASGARKNGVLPWIRARW
jgi:hypothetical protein